MVKMYKGFNKDMTCNGFQYEEGKEYTCNGARLCEHGFHACEMPLDCFRYYKPDKSVYHEVELDASGEYEINDSKRCGKKIKIGAKLEIADIVRAQIEITREHADNIGGNYGINTGGDYSTNAGGDYSTNAGSYRSTNAGGEYSTNAGGSWSTNAGSYMSTNVGGGCSINAGGFSSTNAGGFRSTNVGGDWNTNVGGDWSTNAGGDYSTNAGGYGSTNAGGENSLCVCWNGKCKGGVGSLLVIGHRYFNGDKWVVDGYAHGIVDGEKIKADTWYEYKDGELVEVAEDE